jgi:hypothetical protein
MHKDKRRYPRDDRFAGTHIEAVVNDARGYNPLSGAVLVNHSEGGFQIDADMTPNLGMGKVVVVFIKKEHSSEKRRIESVIVWMSENDGKIRLGCELTYPIVGMHF